MTAKDREYKGQLLDSYQSVKVFAGFPYPQYEVVPPDLSDQEWILCDSLSKTLQRKANLQDAQRQLGSLLPQSFSENFRKMIVEWVESQDMIDRLPSSSQLATMRQALTDFLTQYTPFATHVSTIVERVIQESVGLGAIAPMMTDEYLEEIMVNGENRRVFVFHKKHGMCQTNIYFTDQEDFQTLIARVARTAGKHFDAQNTMLDARLPDGSRANATYRYVTPFGSTLTIRKFSHVPISVINLIQNKTFTPEVAAFLWLMIEGFGIEPMNIIVAGGTSSGKTTTLSALGSFIPYSERLISIEDTLELDFGDRENWVQMESRLKSHEAEAVSMDDLLRNSLRMRPDRITVGEVRSREAQTMFVAMDTGHRGVMGTLHANNAKETLLRLKSEPMAVPEAMLPLLDLIVVQYRQYQRDVGIIRRISQVTEISRMNEQVLLSNVFEWDPAKDTIKRTDVPSRVIEVLADKSGNTKKDVMRELAVRQRILEWMLQQNISNTKDVEKVIQGYYYNPKVILEKVTEGL